MADWISADTPPEESGTYLVCLDCTEQRRNEPVMVDRRHYNSHRPSSGWSLHANDGPVVYWMKMPDPPLEDMIRDKLRGKHNLLVPKEG